MEYNTKNWPFKWFGVWKEYGEGYENYPSINNFIDASKNRTYDIQNLKKYLSEGINLVSTSRIAFPPVFDNELRTGSISYKTDGKWLWLDNIIEFIEHNNLVIPEDWYKDIKQVSFTIDNSFEIDPEKLEWPFMRA